MSGVSENNIKELLLTILNHDGQITLQDFISRVSSAFSLNSNDLSQSLTRPNEALFEQRVRNLISHDNLPEGVEYIAVQEKTKCTAIINVCPQKSGVVPKKSYKKILSKSRRFRRQCRCSEIKS